MNLTLSKVTIKDQLIHTNSMLKYQISPKTTIMCSWSWRSIYHLLIRHLMILRLT